MATHLPNERALVAAAQRGNHEAFAALVNQYQQNVYRLALRITGNHEDAEDALQEALLKAYSNLRRFQGGSLFYTWLVRITMNEALMKLRRSKRQNSRQLPIEEVWPLNSAPVAVSGKGPADPESCYARVELRETLVGALNGISNRLSDAFVLRNVADLSIKETAATLGLSVAGVKSRLLRARCRLRQKLRKGFARKASAQPARRTLRPTVYRFRGPWEPSMGNRAGVPRELAVAMTGDFFSDLGRQSRDSQPAHS